MSKSKHTPKNEAFKIIANNPSAYFHYYISEVVEAGIVLRGTEIKSIREQGPNLKDSYVEITKTNNALEAWLVGMNISPYRHGNIWNHTPERRRKLLLHRAQIKKLFGSITQDGLTLVPTRIYFKANIAKIEIGIGKGKKLHDKRESIKEKNHQREMDRATKIR